MLRKGSETTRRSKTDRRLGLGRNARRWFRIGNQRAAALRYLWGFFDILLEHAGVLLFCALIHASISYHFGTFYIFQSFVTECDKLSCKGRNSCEKE